MKAYTGKYSKRRLVNSLFPVDKHRGDPISPVSNLQDRVFKG